MKTKLITLFLSLVAIFSASATPVKISAQGSNIVLRWPSQSTGKFIVGYRSTLDASDPWTLLRTNFLASSSNETIFVVTNVVPFQNFGGGGGAMASLSSGSGTTSSASLLAAARSAEFKQRWKHDLEIIMPTKLQGQSARRVQATATTSGLSGAEAAAPASNALVASPVTSGFFMVSENYEDVDGDGLPSLTELSLNLNPFVKDTNGNSVDDGHENFDGDSWDNVTEVLVGTDPAVADSEVWQPPSIGGVFSGDVTFNLTFTVDTTNSLGQFLDANGYTADGIVTTAPTSTSVRMRWNSTFIDREFFFAAAGVGSELPQLSQAEVNALQDAFGQGTGFRDANLSTLSAPSQGKVDGIARETLEKYEQISANQLRKDFQWIQEVNTGVRQIPPQDVQRLMNARLASIHTQFTRMRSIGGSLARRFGRAVGRALPFLGGIMILANSQAIADQFLSAMQDYAHDMANGDDETGSAAILAGTCNDLAPGSGNFILAFILR